AHFMQESVTFAGEYYRIEKLDALPRPVQQPRPPIMIGGRQRRMLSFASREADIVGISLLDPPGEAAPSFAQKVAWIREAAGDRWDAIELHVNARAVGIGDSQDSPGALVGPSIDAIVEKLQAQ